VAGVGGFEGCPFTPNCPIYGQLKIQQNTIHNPCTNEKLKKPFRMIRVADDE